MPRTTSACRLAATLAATTLLAAACASPRADVASAEAEMTPEQMTQRMVELGTPGPEHHRLEELVGKWKATGQFWMAPDTPPEPGIGVSVNTMELGGRYLKQEYDGDYMGQPFSGVGYTGFDNTTRRYQGVWLDSMSTGIMPASTGTADESGKVITFTREFVDPMSGQPTATREVMTLVDHDHHRFEWFQRMPDGSFFLMMKFDYERVP